MKAIFTVIIIYSAELLINALAVWLLWTWFLFPITGRLIPDFFYALGVYLFFSILTRTYRDSTCQRIFFAALAIAIGAFTKFVLL